MRVYDLLEFVAKIRDIEGKAFKHRLNHTKLKAGDVLLLQGNKSEMDELFILIICYAYVSFS